jgi:hypothetical protein
MLKSVSKYIITTLLLCSLFFTACSKLIVTDSCLWLYSTHAIMTLRNGGNLNLLGGCIPSESQADIFRQTLSTSWGIENKADGATMIEHLKAGLANRELLDHIAARGLDQLTEAEFQNVLDQFYEAYTEEQLADDNFRIALQELNISYEAYQRFGENAILAWDLSRATQLLSYFYVAGYYTYEEAMDEALVIGKMIQSSYDSWSDYWDSYLYGYLHWSGDLPEDPASEYSIRRQLVENQDYDPQKSNGGLAWELDLVKDW